MIAYNFKGMGSCFSYCCREQNKRARHVKPAGYFDTSSLIEFETLIDEQSTSEPKSMSSWLNFKKGKLAFHQEDALELEEEAKALPDAVEAPPISAGQRVVMRSKLSKEDNWTGADHNAWALAGEEEILNAAKLRCQGHQPSCPQFQAKAWEKERERLNSSPHSSLDLEWENEVATKCIPQTNGHPGKRRVPWWNSECQNARKQQNKAWRSPTAANLDSFKKVKSRGRRTRRQARRESWQEFFSGINSYTQESKVWNVVGRVAGRQAHKLPLVNTQSDTLEDQANFLGTHFERVSSFSHYTDAFQKYRTRIEK
ncbi:uncharacterized protein LOC119161470 isoform X2 [Rhipicephalus microplus]|uniref:uncharacterized protein LOC119161470 isoform X2 n=1 Tax=Rhipicephalus microplus TaxID=6941 RepID=UPI003F6C0A7A